MKNLRKTLITSSVSALVFSVVVLMQCTSNQSKTSSTSTTQVQSSSSSTAQNTSEGESSYVNLYDGRSAFPDSVHKSWQDGNLDQARESVLTYIDGMIAGIEQDIVKYQESNDTEKLNIELEKLERVKDLKVKILNAKNKNELKDIMHGEFRFGNYKDKFGSGK